MPLLEEFRAEMIRPDDLLVFDYDGTLADFVPDPPLATVPPEVVEALGRLAARQPVIVISGREVEEIDRFLSPLKLPVSGAHGRKFRTMGQGAIDQPPLPPLPQALRDLAERVAARHPGSRIEVKDDHAFGFHVRPMDPALRQAALDEFRNGAEALLPGTGYRLQPGNMVIELCPAGFDKGQALSRFLAMPEYCDRRVFYFGDDLTDEYAFAVLTDTGKGIGVLVGPRALAPETVTRAGFMLPSPAAMRAVVCATNVIPAKAGTQDCFPTS